MQFDFNVYSSLLLIFFVHGTVYSILCLLRARKTGYTSDTWLGIFLLLCILYIFPWMTGFAGWYNQQPYRDFLFYMPFQHLYAIGPVVFFYTQSLLNPAFRFARAQWWHMLPALLYLVFSIIMVLTDKVIARRDIFLADGSDPDFDTWYQLTGFLSMLLYVAASFRYYVLFRRLLQQISSFADRFRFDYVRHFLLAFCGMLLLRLLFFTLDYFSGLNYIGNWWYFLGFALLFYYIAIAGFGAHPQHIVPYQLQLLSAQPVYFLQAPAALAAPDGRPRAEPFELSFPAAAPAGFAPDPAMLALSRNIEALMVQQQLYEDPELTLAALAKPLQTNVSVLSKTINACFGKNFNDYVNGYRVAAVKDAIARAEHRQTTLEGLGYRYGFNSKATFFRAFKKLTGHTPATYLETL